jgi:hypothetical protein
MLKSPLKKLKRLIPVPRASLKRPLHVVDFPWIVGGLPVRVGGTMLQETKLSPRKLSTG